MHKTFYSFYLFFLFVSLMIPVYAKSISLQSNSLANETTIPIDYTCAGKNISPSLEWKDVPKQTQSFALIVSDPDAPNGVFYHWVLYNIPSTVTQLKEGITTLPHGTQVGKNSGDANQYKGPCPPPGKPHRYIFTLYALNTMLNLPADANAETVLKAMQNHVLDVAEIKYTFGR